jgi:hypothetical protein
LQAISSIRTESLSGSCVQQLDAKAVSLQAAVVEAEQKSSSSLHQWRRMRPGQPTATLQQQAGEELRRHVELPAKML